MTLRDLKEALNRLDSSCDDFEVVHYDYYHYEESRIGSVDTLDFDNKVRLLNVE